MEASSSRHIEIMEACGSGCGGCGGEDSFFDLVRRSLPGDTDPPTAPRTMYVDADGFWNPGKQSHQPSVVAIGPFCRAKTLPITSHDKHSCLRYLLSRFSLPEQQPSRANTPREHKLMRSLVEKIRADEELARRYFPRASNKSDPEFVAVLLLDACFILFILLIPFIAWERSRKMQAECKKLKHQLAPPKHKDKDDDLGRLLSHLESHFGQIKLDLLLLHNQIPFLVIQHLFDSIPQPEVEHISAFFELKQSSETRDVSLLCSLDMASHKTKDVSLVDLALKFFDQIEPRRNPDYRPPPEAKYILHLLHLFHSALEPSADYRMTKTNQLELGSEESPERTSIAMCVTCSCEAELGDMYIPSATELAASGVKLRRNKEARSLLEVSFCGGALQIPTVSLSDYSGALFGNLIAFEQYYSSGVRPYVSAYAALMACVVRRKPDVMLLQQRGALVNNLGADDVDVVVFFRQFGAGQQQVGADPFGARSYLRPLSKKLADHHRRRWPKWKADLRRGYCSNPWVILSFVGASFLLVLTFLQTFYAMMEYYRK